MNLSQSLAHTAAVFEPKTLPTLREHLDPQWVLQALEDTGTVTIRRRRLPAEEMIWLVIGMAILRDNTIVEIAQMLSVSRPGGAPFEPIGKGSAFFARERIGKEPVAWLFGHSARTWAHRSAADDRFCGLSLYGLDGTSLRVPDTAKNAERFGYSQSVRGESAYPLVRLVALMALRSHLLAAAAFGPYDASEQSYAAMLWNELPKDSLCVFDRNFFSAKLLLSLSSDPARNQHWLIRGKKNLAYREIERFGPNDQLVELTVSSEARKKDPTLPETFIARRIGYQRKGFAPSCVLTSLIDPSRFLAEAVVSLYHERWELELGYDEIKTELLDRRESIRSKKPDGVEQEIWGLLLAY